MRIRIKYPTDGSHHSFYIRKPKVSCRNLSHYCYKKDHILIDLVEEYKNWKDFFCYDDEFDLMIEEYLSKVIIHEDMHRSIELILEEGISSPEWIVELANYLISELNEKEGLIYHIVGREYLSNFPKDEMEYLDKDENIILKRVKNWIIFDNELEEFNGFDVEIDEENDR